MKLGWFVWIFAVLACGAPEPPPPCEGSACGRGARIQLEPQGDFGSLVCQGEAAQCRMDFGVLGVRASAESWTVLRNVGDARLHLEALQVSDPVFEVQHPALQLDPGEELSFRLRVRIDQADQQLEGTLSLYSDAVNGTPVESGCSARTVGCTHISVALSASTNP